jgi:hypothetical protein
MSVVIPTLLARTSADGEETYTETSTRLLELAAVDQEVFRAVVGGMSANQRTFLEEVIRSGQRAMGNQGKTTSGQAEQPTIALKMSFGG